MKAAMVCASAAVAAWKMPVRTLSLASWNFRNGIIAPGRPAAMRRSANAGMNAQ